MPKLRPYPEVDPFPTLKRGHYKVIATDVPWHFSTRSVRGQGRSPSRHYRTMTLADIMALPVEHLAADDCMLMFWTTGTHLEQAFAVLKAWGFKYSGMGFTWLKLKKRHAKPYFTDADVHAGTGYTSRKNQEFVLFARRGSPKRLRKDVREPIIEPRREHSRKPEQFYDRAVRLYDGPRVELFARQVREGWDSWGNETSRFEGPALFAAKTADTNSSTPSPSSALSEKERAARASAFADAVSPRAAAATPRRSAKKNAPRPSARGAARKRASSKPNE